MALERPARYLGDPKKRIVVRGVRLDDKSVVRINYGGNACLHDRRHLVEMSLGSERGSLQSCREIARAIDVDLIVDVVRLRGAIEHLGRLNHEVNQRQLLVFLLLDITRVDEGHRPGETMHEPFKSVLLRVCFGQVAAKLHAVRTNHRDVE